MSMIEFHAFVCCVTVLAVGIASIPAGLNKALHTTVLAADLAPSGDAMCTRAVSI